MKKIVWILIGTAFAISSCSLMVRFAGGIKDPKVENKATIHEYLQDVHCPFTHTYVLKGSNDSTELYDNLFKAMRSNTVLYDSTGVPLQYTGSSTCSGTRMHQAFSAPDSFYQASVNDSLNLFELMNEFERLDGTVEDGLPHAQYYYVYYWGRYFEKKRQMEGNYYWMDTMRANSDHKVLVLLVNTDMQESWGLHKKGRVKLKMKTRKTKQGWSMEMTTKEKNLR